MDVLKILLATGGAVVLILIILAIKNKAETENISGEEALKQCFGDPIYSEVFTLNEAKKWITANKDKITDGKKAAIMKVNDKFLESIGKSSLIGNVGYNYLILTISAPEDKNYNDSALIKYNELDGELEKLLGPEGMVVIS